MDNDTTDPTYEPIEHLRAFIGHYPQLPRQIDDMRADRGKALPDWPDWCFLPIAGWMELLRADPDYEGDIMAIAADVGRVAAVGTWRYTQGVYMIDPALRSALTETEIDGDIPSEVFLRLPEWSVYVDTTGMAFENDDLHGFWAHLEWDANTGRPELRLLLATDDALIVVPIHLGAWTLVEAMRRVTDTASANVGFSLPDRSVDMAEAIQPLVSILLYLCSEEPDIDNARTPGSSPGRPEPKRVKRGWRLFPPDRPTVWTVGATIGASIRRDRDAARNTGRSVRPHIRRGHWHGYWRGPRDGDQTFVYHWLPPMVVAAGDDA